MPGQRARRHFSQLCEFETGLIIGIKTARWSTRRVAVQVDRSECVVINCWEQWTREGTHARKTGSGATRKTTRRKHRRIVQQALVNPTWCQARSTWNVTDWQKIVFSDESRFVLGTDDNRVRVWRRPGERYNSSHNVPRHSARTAGVMVWGPIAYDSRYTLIVMRGTLTGQRYVVDILRPHILLWPSRSPDLSPVEHVRDQLKRQMPSCHSVHDLELAVQDLWAHLSQDNIRCLINPMPNRVAACIAAGGRPTRY
ncbi:transposable element Tcb1 transposase [Trichonephila clavipes]|uniref:Transposable element Tcb1 transposase n=1 Tax=Trichonephila clavipes TaxID=2585209 RepID=A0A8X6RMI7_TRICX|nr:transposable element Tcb1 transposase [Trichonephila clavipes]